MEYRGSILKSGAYTVSGTFDRFLDAEINIKSGIRQLSSISQSHLREFLKGEEKRDSGFPGILDGEDFIGGSFGRHTKNWPLDDIDIYLPLNGAGLVYIESGLVQPYNVLSSRTLPNPLLAMRWANEPQLISSKKLISGFARVLSRHYPNETAVNANGEAVTVRMTYGETEDEYGLGYDVVPCFRLLAQNRGDQNFYLIPDGNDGWISTAPDLDLDLADYLNRYHNGFYRKAVKLVKWWNKNILKSKIPSYYVELSIARTFRKRATDSGQILTIGSAISIALGAFALAIQAGDQESWLIRAPKVERGEITKALERLAMITASKAITAVSSEASGNDNDALKTWREIFGESFPMT